MLRRTRWTRTLVGLSALALVAAGCGGEEFAEQPEAAPSDDVEASDVEASDDVDAPDSDADEASEEPSPEPADLQVTAYVVAYHWGWALFDEDGNELETLDVPVGTEVELVAVNDHASHAIEQLPAPVAETIRSVDWHERAHHDVEMGRIPDPETVEGVSLSEALTAAHDGHDHMAPARDHGLMVTGIGVETFLDAHADEPERLMFTVEREGVHEFRCTEDCGVGHENQRWEMLVVSA